MVAHYIACDLRYTVQVPIIYPWHSLHLQVAYRAIDWTTILLENLPDDAIASPYVTKFSSISLYLAKPYVL